MNGDGLTFPPPWDGPDRTEPSALPRPAHRAPPPTPAPAPPVPPAALRSGRHDHQDADLLRPFVLTGGRTHPHVPGLRVETQLRTRPEAELAPLRFEARRIVEVCRLPRSVAEIAVLLGLPLGVVRILAADLLSEQLLSREAPSEISVALLERIIDGVRAL